MLAETLRHSSGGVCKLNKLGDLCRVCEVVLTWTDVLPGGTAWGREAAVSAAEAELKDVLHVNPNPEKQEKELQHV